MHQVRFLGIYVHSDFVEVFFCFVESVTKDDDVLFQRVGDSQKAYIIDIGSGGDRELFG